MAAGYVTAAGDNSVVVAASSIPWTYDANKQLSANVNGQTVYLVPASNGGLTLSSSPGAGWNISANANGYAISSVSGSGGVTQAQCVTTSNGQVTLGACNTRFNILPVL